MLRFDILDVFQGGEAVKPPEHQVYRIFDVIFPVAEIGHFLPGDGGRDAGHVRGHQAVAVVPDVHHRIEFTETLSDSSRALASGSPSVARGIDDVTLHIHEQTIAALSFYRHKP